MGLLLIGPVAAVVGYQFLPEPSGHWSGHMASALLSAGVAVAVLLGTALVVKRLPWHALASVAVVVIGLTLEVVGNVRVAAALWATSYDDAEAGVIGPSFPGYVWGHRVVDRGDQLAILGGLALVLSLGFSRRVGKVAAVTCGVLALFPQWVYPALGSVVLLAWFNAARPYRADEKMEPGPEPPTRVGDLTGG
jgi:hypothetical protein